jgi:murein DD-endopeptidase MepM/ murein hydrolase activator NlpD
MIAVLMIASACLLPPVEAPISDHFREPACPYCAGNRGLEYLVTPGTAVTAAAPGTVEFSGEVAGVRYVVVRHLDGRRATYGKLQVTTLRVGDRVIAGQRIGTTSAALYFGLREGERYVDPEPLLAVLRRRARLVPVDGTPPRPVGPPVTRCPAGESTTASTR